MSSTILFYLLMLMLSMLTMTKPTTDKAYKITIRNHKSKSAESENLKIILNYVRGKQKFYPSIFSLVSLDSRSSLIDLLSKYVTNESIVNYKTNDFSRNYTWHSRIDLTWIFIIDSMNIFNSFVHEQSHIWKSTNQYLVIVTMPNTTLSRMIFQIIWKTYGVYRVIIISIKDDFRCLSRYLPFEKNWRNEYGVVHKICLMNQEDTVELYTNFNKLNGYPVRVVVFPSLMMKIASDENVTNSKFSGVDANAMLLLERVMGARFHVYVSHNLRNSTNEEGHYGDPFYRTLRYIENGESEMIIISFFTHRYKEYQKYEFTASIYEDKLCLIAPTASFVPKSYMPIMSFAPDLWVALAIYNVLVSVLWFLIKYYSVSFRRQSAVLLPLTRTMNNNDLSRRSNLPLKIHPYILSCFDLLETSCYPLKENGNSGVSNTTIAQRVFLIGTLFFGLIIIGLYQSCLMSSLSDPFHYPELNTLEDVASSNLTIITKYYNLKENTFTGNTTLDNKLRSKMKVFVSKEHTYDVVAFGRKTIAINRYASVKLGNLSKYYDIDGNKLLHIVEECPTTYLLSYVIKLHSPYRERINGLLLRMQEAGLIHLWYERMANPLYITEQRRRMNKSERKVKLTMEHFSLTFVGFTAGLLFCTIVFLVELYFAKFQSP
ncbi:uncharacterized protein LOC105828127 [Monomorium pharaonis]|uniref:uncharacterized protein LOC105828127 n=1 Tax=Monomorium pharaonis TaxID=307658 RepID=UPI00063EE646|nr:uncharacterized protein LOC105828127 [Monomorium pharaonis]